MERRKWWIDPTTEEDAYWTELFSEPPGYPSIPVTETLPGDVVLSASEVESLKYNLSQIQREKHAESWLAGHSTAREEISEIVEVAEEILEREARKNRAKIQVVDGQTYYPIGSDFEQNANFGRLARLIERYRGGQS